MANLSPIIKFFVGIFIVGLLLLTAGIGFLFYLPDYNARKDGNVSPPILASDVNKSNFSISKIAIDSRHNIHLIYESNRNEYKYARSSDLGKSWGVKTDDSSSAPGNQNSTFAALTIVDDTVVIWARSRYSEYLHNYQGVLSVGHGELLRTISYDSGITWSKEQKALFENQQNNGLIGKTKFAFYDDILFCILEKGETAGTMGLYFSKSGDWGTSWSELIELIAPKYYNNSSPISLCMSDSVLFVGFQGKTRPDGTVSSIIVLRSMDNGETWGMLSQIYLNSNSSDPSGIQYITDLTMESISNKLIISLLYGYFKYYISDDYGVTWQRHELKIRPENGRTFYLNKNSELNLIWVDNRNSYRGWRSYLPAPLSYMLIWDDDPSWPNNDLYQQNLDKPGSTPQRLTPPYSYIMPPYLYVSNFDDSLMVMWLGREKINSKYEVFSEPAQLLYKFIPNN